ncbi:MAG: UPF0175 family protein [Terrimicrobiaceae bacterium]
MTSDLAKLELAVALYRDRKVSLGRGAKLAGLPSPEFLRQVGRRGVTVNYDIADLEKDVVALSALP